MFLRSAYLSALVFEAFKVSIAFLLGVISKEVPGKKVKIPTEAVPLFPMFWGCSVLFCSDTVLASHCSEAATKRKILPVSGKKWTPWQKLARTQEMPTSASSSPFQRQSASWIIPANVCEELQIFLQVQREVSLFSPSWALPTSRCGFLERILGKLTLSGHFRSRLLSKQFHFHCFNNIIGHADENYLAHHEVLGHVTYLSFVFCYICAKYYCVWLTAALIMKAPGLGSKTFEREDYVFVFISDASAATKTKSLTSI